MIPNTQFTSLLTAEEAATYLKISVSAVRHWTSSGYIPHVRIGRNVRYNIRAIEKWIEKRSFAGRITKIPTASLPAGWNKEKVSA